MTWLHVADVVRRAQCFERQRYKRCNCRSGKSAKAYNPCQRHEEVAQECESLDAGTGGSPDEVAEWLVRHTCHASRRGRMCQHRGCMDREGALDFVIEQARKKAV